MSIAVGNVERFLRRFKNWMRGERGWSVPIAESGGLRNSFRASPPQRVQIPPAGPLAPRDFLDTN